MLNPKFFGIDFSTYEVTELNPGHADIGRGFRCARGEFAAYIKGEKIKNELRTFTSKCWVIYCKEGLASYITLLADKLTMGTPILIDENVHYSTFPAVKVGWLAADPRAKKSGARLLEWAMEYVAMELVSRLGIRFITVDALYDSDNLENPYDASGFYAKNGFRFADPDEALPPKDGFRSMYFDLMPLIQQIEAIKISG